MDAGEVGHLVVSVNTRSLHNERAGFDSRVRKGTLRGTWSRLPPRGVERCTGFDYAAVEDRANIYFEPCDRITLEGFLIEICRRASLLEVWGVPYSVPVEGIHQVHSRRASCAIRRDILGLDGALQFYFAGDQSCLLVLLKFCGQP
ncbi:hypothetical protein BH09VER1_BH09VER1_19980 [soil metagenome]